MPNTHCNLRMATFNVHNFKDACGVDNFDRVKELIEKHEPHVVCLQEAGHATAQRLLGSFRVFSRSMRFSFLEIRNNVGIMSRYPIKQIICDSHRGRKKWPRYVTVELDLTEVSGVHLTLGLTCLHLSHKFEPNRMREINTIMEDIRGNQRINFESSFQAITGDFNALTTSDYDPDYLANITEVRKRNRWEEPRSDVTDAMKSMWRMSDAKSLALLFEGFLSTCRFDTRIDYFYFNDFFVKSGSSVKRLLHVADPASDHSMVIVDVQLRK